jgi:serine/threonine protein kinase
MADAPPPCAACRWPLGSDDLFCPRCGTPTSLNVDPQATLVNPAGPQDATADKAPGSAAPLGAAAFNDRLRQVLGGEYELVSLLGQGGFARVFRARDKRLDRSVAIKVIRPDLMERQGFVERFRNEGIALAKLRHPGIVPIFDIRERGGLIYYIMPFVQGTTLEARMNRARLPPLESRRILSELADALAAAHRAQMVHLDIKPANVFLEGDFQTVLLMDFGIAMALTGPIEEPSGGPVVGTPEYMSPEQARGLPEIDHRSDIYSLGALGYRMLMGRPPFRGQTAAETLAKHINEAAVPMRDINPTIPKELADAVMRCLSKDPADRFRTALELRGALESVTFFGAPGEPGGRAALSGVRGTLVVLIAGLALLIGLLVGQALLAPARSP